MSEIDYDYRRSLNTRLRLLFSPLRLTLFIIAIAWIIGLNVVYIRNDGGPQWLGFASIIPVSIFFVWTMATDRRYRKDAKRKFDD